MRPSVSPGVPTVPAVVPPRTDSGLGGLPLLAHNASSGCRQVTALSGEAYARFMTRRSRWLGIASMAIALTFAPQAAAKLCRAAPLC